jgi:hypothetical protein
VATSYRPNVVSIGCANIDKLQDRPGALPVVRFANDSLVRSRRRPARCRSRGSFREEKNRHSQRRRLEPDDFGRTSDRPLRYDGWRNANNQRRTCRQSGTSGALCRQWLGAMTVVSVNRGWKGKNVLEADSPQRARLPRTSAISSTKLNALSKLTGSGVCLSRV